MTGRKASTARQAKPKPESHEAATIRYMANANLWPMMLLPLKRDRNKFAKSEGFLYSPGTQAEGCKVYLGNIYGVKSLEGLEVLTYDTLDAAVVDGWRVD